MNILGINAVYHDPAVALLVDGELVVAVEEERFNRIKHGKLPDVDNPHQFPERAIKFCLDYAGLKPSDLDHVGYSFDPELRRKRFKPDWWPNPMSEEVFRLRLAQVRGTIDRILERKLGPRFHFVQHHLAHAASAYFPSPFERAALLTIDGIGETAGSTLAKANGTRIQHLETFEFPHSLGFAWESICAYTGFSPYDASKLMGLAAYGNPKTFQRQLEEMIHVTDDNYSVDPEAIGFLTAKMDKIETLLGPPRYEGMELEQRHADIAAALQESTNAAVLAMVRRLKKKVPYDQLCFAGGVALNCVTNELIQKSGEFRDVFITYCPHDAGTAIGAAYIVHAAKSKTPPKRGHYSPYLGPSFKRREILEAVKLAGFRHKISKNPARDAAKMIADGKIVAWFQGRMEFGPRALGNRSLLADPRRPEMRNILNQKVKHREDFRPFAPSVLAEYADEWFEIGGSHSPSHEFMLFACAAKGGQRDRIPAVLHHDGSGRLQLVRKASNRRYHELISAFHELTGVPMVINTSFNDSEPVVCTPSDAIVTFRKSGIDALFMEDVVLTAQK